MHCILVSLARKENCLQSGDIVHILVVVWYDLFLRNSSSSTMSTMVIQASNTFESDHMLRLRRASSSSEVPDKREDKGDQPTTSRSQSAVTNPAKAAAPSLKGLVTEYFGPGQRLREIYLRSEEGDTVPVPITLAVQLSPKLRDFVEKVMMEATTRGRNDSSDNSMSVPCSSDALKIAVEFVTAKLEWDLQLSEEGIRLKEEEKKEHWRDYIYYRVAWRFDLDEFAENILKIADYLSIQSLYDLLRCCFRLKF